MQYKIEAVSPEARDYKDNYGPKVAYRVRASGPGVGPDEVLEMKQKPTTTAPKAGDTFDGEILPSSSPGVFPRILKRAYQSNGQSNSQGSGQGAFYKPRDPQDTAKIQRQHSQEMALRTFALTGRWDTIDIVGNPQAFAKFQDELATLAGFFDRDIAHGARASINASGYGDAPTPKNPPVDPRVSDVPTPEFAEFPVASGVSNGQGDDIPF